MATCTVNKVIRMVETEVVEGVVLTMTQEEAETLRLLLHHVGGDPYKTRRGHVDAIRKSLDKAGVKLIQAEAFVMSGSVHFPEL